MSIIYIVVGAIAFKQLAQANKQGLAITSRSPLRRANYVGKEPGGGQDRGLEHSELLICSKAICPYITLQK